MPGKSISVVGLGYVGLPISLKFAQAGYSVVGIDKDSQKVEIINRGENPIKGNEPGLSKLLMDVLASGNIKVTTTYDSISSSDYILIVVETPFDVRNREPIYTSLRAATKKVGEHLSKGSLVVVESTIAPGTINNIIRPILETESALMAGVDFFLAAAPERVMPGKLLYNLEHLDRVIGGIDEESTIRALELYKTIIGGELFGTDALTAEVVKTVENSYRDVQIAFANEIALLCENIGVDVFSVRELVNKSPYRNMHLPGAGVGGHCIPKDSWLLAFGAKGKHEPRLLAVAREINDGMPYHMSRLCESALHTQGKRVYGTKIAVLGLSYLENTDDTRNSPAFGLVKALEVLGAQPIVHDPYVRGADNIVLTHDFEEALRGADCLALVTAHDEYRNLDLDYLKSLMRTHVIVDGRNIFNKDECMKHGFIYKGVGR